MFRSVRKFATMPDLSKNFVPKDYKGLTLDQMRKIRKENLNPALTTYYSEPLPLAQGYKQWLFDINGKRYLDMFGGICTVSVGHCHPKVIGAIKDQMDTLGHVSTVYFYSKIHEYAQRLTEKMPGNLKVVYFVNSGSEANDLALLMVRSHTRRHHVMSLKNCYHGMTYQLMALTSNNYYKYPVAYPGGFHNVRNPDEYTGIWGGNKCRNGPVQADRTCSCTDECEAGKNYVKEFEEEFKYTIPKNGLAAFWAESMQGVGGAVQYPKNYIKGVYEVVKKQGGLFISDEVQTGFGRTGDNFWGFQMHDIVPDVVTMAKGIGNGFPLAAVITTPEIAAGLSRAGHFNTYGGNPLACAAGIAVLDIIEEEQLQKNSKEVGTYFLLKLAKLREKYSIIGDVRGKGLMIGVELIEDSENRTPLNPAKFLKIWEYCRDKGVIIGKGGINGNVFRLKPPMCVTREDVDFATDVIEEALNNV